MSVCPSLLLIGGKLIKKHCNSVKIWRDYTLALLAGWQHDFSENMDDPWNLTLDQSVFDDWSGESRIIIRDNDVTEIFKLVKKLDEENVKQTGASQLEHQLSISFSGKYLINKLLKCMCVKYLTLTHFKTFVSKVFLMTRISHLFFKWWLLFHRNWC